MGGCQNYGPFLGTLNIRCRTIMATQKGTIMLTIPHMVGKVDVRAEMQSIVRPNTKNPIPTSMARPVSTPCRGGLRFRV